MDLSELDIFTPLGQLEEIESLAEMEILRARLWEMAESANIGGNLRLVGNSLGNSHRQYQGLDLTIDASGAEVSAHYKGRLVYSQSDPVNAKRLFVPGPWVTELIALADTAREQGQAKQAKREQADLQRLKQQYREGV